jgi:hypothetical protein
MEASYSAIACSRGFSPRCARRNCELSKAASYNAMLPPTPIRRHAVNGVAQQSNLRRLPGNGSGAVRTWLRKSSCSSVSRAGRLSSWEASCGLSRWGPGGVVGTAAILPALGNAFAQKGYAVIAGLMAIGALLSVPCREAEEKVAATQACV